LKIRKYYITSGGYETKGVKVAYEVKDSIFLDRYKEMVLIKIPEK
jgi:hypothetical protein